MDFNDSRCPSQTNDNYFDASQHYNQENYDNDLNSLLDGAIDQYKTPDLTLLAPCEFCSRTFLPTSLAKHKRVCYKNWCKHKDKTDNSYQNNPPTQPYGYGGDKSILTIEKMLAKRRHRRLNWRLRHEEFLRAVHAARDYAEAVASGNPLPPPPAPIIEPDLKGCPYCHRKFHEKSYEKHIKRCKEQSLRSNREKPSYQTMEAKRRLAVRLYYTPNSRPNSCLPMSNSPTPSNMSRPSSRQTELDFGAYADRYSSLSGAERNIENRIKIPDHIFDNIAKLPGRRTPRASSTDSRKSSTPTIPDAYTNPHFNPNYSRPVSRTGSSMSDNYNRQCNGQGGATTPRNAALSRSNSRQNIKTQQKPQYNSRKPHNLSRAPSEQSLASNSPSFNRPNSTIYNHTIDNPLKKRSTNNPDPANSNQYSGNTPTSNIRRSTSCCDIDKKKTSIQKKHKKQTSEYPLNMTTSTFKPAPQVNKPFSCSRPTSIEPVSETYYNNKYNPNVKPASKLSNEKKNKPEQISRPNSVKSNKSDNSLNIAKEISQKPVSTNRHRRSSKSNQKHNNSGKNSQANSTENLDQFLSELKKDTSPILNLAVKPDIDQCENAIDNERNTIHSPQPVTTINPTSKSTAHNRVRNEMQIRIKPHSNQSLEPEQEKVINNDKEEIKDSKKSHHHHHHRHKHHKHKSQDNIALNHDVQQNKINIQSSVTKPSNPEPQFQTSPSNVSQPVNFINSKGESPNYNVTQMKMNSQNYVSNWNKAQGDSNQVATTRANFSDTKIDHDANENANQNNGLRVSSTIYQCKTIRSISVTEKDSNSNKNHRHHRKTSSSSITNQPNQNNFKSSVNLKDNSHEKTRGKHSRNHSNTSGSSNVHNTGLIKVDSCTGCGQNFPNIEANFCGCCGIKRSFVV